MKVPRLSNVLLGLFAVGALFSLTTTQAATLFSLAGDFSYQSNPNGVWSYHIDDYENATPTFPLLAATNLTANDLWGTAFPNPPMMWSDGTGYWGIGKNFSGVDQISAPQSITWGTNQVFLHPKGTPPSPGRLVIGWTAPQNHTIDVHYSFARGMTCGNGVGYQILKRSGGVDSVVEDFGVGGITGDGPINRSLFGMSVQTGDQLFFRIDTWGDAGCDVTMASIEIAEASFESPSLAIEKARILSWPVFPPGYVLQAAPTPEGPYESVTGTPVLAGGRYKLVVGPEVRHYRLIRPE